MQLITPTLNRLLDIWLDEDLGRGDLTQAALYKGIGSADWITKQKGIFCGSALVERLFHKLDESVRINFLVTDGEHFEAGQTILELTGPTAALVAGERTALNIAMHLSGIATSTAALVAELEGTGVHLADTRKTTPGLRILEKYAVRCGGGINHRLGLDDTAMLKENHLAWGNGIEASLKSIRATAPWPTQIIVEAETPQQAEQAIKAGADGILLDEIPPEVLTDLIPRLRELAAQRTQGRRSNHIVLEASGVDPRALRAYAKTGVDFISSSKSITASTWIDFSMRFKTINLMGLDPPK